MCVADADAGGSPMPGHHLLPVLKLGFVCCLHSAALFVTWTVQDDSPQMSAAARSLAFLTTSSSSAVSH